MSLLTKQQDVWKVATEADKASALASLSSLPSRAIGDAAIDKGAYYVALEGVTRYGLVTAVRSILQGSLGHTFFPSPVEIRRECDAAMELHERERRRIALQEQAFRERQRITEVHRVNTPEARARVARIYERFCESFKKDEKGKAPALDPALLAQIPDNPNTKRRLGAERMAQ